MRERLSKLAGFRLSTVTLLCLPLLLLSLPMITACGGASPKPTLQLAEATAATRAAEEVGAPNEPKAALYLKMARDGINNAEILIENEENSKARRVLERARADAELALVLTRSAQKRQEADDAIRRVDSLKGDPQ